MPPSRSSRPKRSIAGAGAEGAETVAASADNHEKDRFRSQEQEQNQDEGKIIQKEMQQQEMIRARLSSVRWLWPSVGRHSIAMLLERL